MRLDDDLNADGLAESLPGRPARAYRALLSTEADALKWARAGAPGGAVVVAGYQASPRGRGGLEWTLRPGTDLGFSLVLRPRLPPEREGWIYTVAATGLADALVPEARIEWPDEVRQDGEPLAALGVQCGVAEQGVEWAVVNVLVRGGWERRAALLREAVEAIEAREQGAAATTLADHRARCETLGLSVRARLIPLGPGGTEVSGTASDLRDDGALVIETAKGNQVPVRPQDLGVLEVADLRQDEPDDIGDGPLARR